MAQVQTQDKMTPDSTPVVRSEGERVSAQQPRERIPFGVARSKLAVSLAIDGYHLRWVNDSPGRIYEAQESYYQFVSPEEIGAEKSEDGKVKRLVGKNEDGSALFAFLMKIKQEYYDEDEILRNQAQDNFDKQIKAGRLDEKSGENRYVPKQGISIKS